MEMINTISLNTVCLHNVSGSLSPIEYIGFCLENNRYEYFTKEQAEKKAKEQGQDINIHFLKSNFIPSTFSFYHPGVHGCSC